LESTFFREVKEKKRKEGERKWLPKSDQDPFKLSFQIRNKIGPFNYLFDQVGLISGLLQLSVRIFLNLNKQFERILIHQTLPLSPIVSLVFDILPKCHNGNSEESFSCSITPISTSFFFTPTKTP
jgi:hypothetical protein